MKKIYLETYGCQMNEYDSELVRSVLEQDFTFTEDFTQADVIMFNTCTVRSHASDVVLNRIGRIRHELHGKDFFIGILGCMASDMKDNLLKDKRLGIDFVVGPDSYKQLPFILNELFEKHEKSFDVDLSGVETYSGIIPSRTKGVNAWVAVMRGCNNFCSFCIVPYVRGRERSRCPDDILKEIIQLASNGFKQITLLGQNVNSYNFEGKSFSDLLNYLKKEDRIKRIRFMSPNPKDFPDQLIQIVADNPDICNHIHLPLQSGNDRILKLMNRKYTRIDYLNLVEKIKNKMTDVVLTTDIIVGFPGETEEEYQDTVSVVKQVEFDSSFIFKYSEREGTLASKKYPDDVSSEIKTKRIVLLNEIQKQISLKKNMAHIGQVHQVLIEQERTKKSVQDYQGRNEGNKLVIIPKGPYHKGDFIDVEIQSASPNVLKGIPV